MCHAPLSQVVALSWSVYLLMDGQGMQLKGFISILLYTGYVHQGYLSIYR